MARLLCLGCRNIADVDAEAPLEACPACGSHGVPANADDTVTVTLTTHELRVLTIWASNFAASIGADAPAMIQGILDHLGTFTAAPLSLSQEIADLRAAFPDSDVRIYRDGQETDE